MVLEKHFVRLQKRFLYMKNTLISLICLVMLCACNAKVIDSLPRSTPEKEGVSSAGILQFVEAAEQSDGELHSFMVLRHGKVIAEGWWNPYRRDFKQTVYSTSKTFTSTAIGFAVSENLLRVEDKVISFFPKELLPDTISPYLAQLRVKDLLIMSAGDEQHSVRMADEWVKTLLATPIAFEPGTKFSYNSMATFMLSAIIQQITGQRLLDYLKPRLFEPLAMSPDIDWEVSPEGINTGGWGIRVRTEDMAKLGQLYLQKGRWNGKQILPEAWIAEATAAHIRQNPHASAEELANNDWVQGYGYQIWRCRHNGFRADGAFGQFIIVLPDQDVVIAIQANFGDMQKEINLVWDYLLPAVQSGNSLPDDKVAWENLQNKLNSLAILPPKSKTANVPGNFEKDYNFFQSKENPTEGAGKFSVKIASDTCFMNFDDHLFIFGNEKWLGSETAKTTPGLLPNNDCTREFPPFKVFGSYAWESDSTLTLYLRYIETPHTEKFVCAFGENFAHVKFSHVLYNGKSVEFSGE
jgi:CubicO group peptidase (beta-lactamase class C family)